MQSNEIRNRFLKFFEKRGHVIIPSASLVPENDPSVLFNTAGMQPLVPYLLGEKHPSGTRLVDSQKCVRTVDIDEVGDNTHATFFEMLGNWSLGDYFKEDAIKWSYEFLTSKEEGLGLDPNRLYITVFEGDEDAPRDEESFEIWKKLGIPEDRIYFMGKESNWWSPGDNGPCGPDSEMFYDLTKDGLGNMTKAEFIKADDKQEVVEIWNDVFMEYEKKEGVIIGKLKKKNVDTGAGLERLSVVIQGKDNIFETDLLKPLVDGISKLTESEDIKAKRVITDHIRTAIFMIGDGVVPSNTDRGYILRRLLRRAIRYMNILNIDQGQFKGLIKIVIDIYQESYPNLLETEGVIVDEIEKEENKFRKTLNRGLKEFKKLAEDGISGEEAFTLFSTYGFPIEMIMELGKESGKEVDQKGFDEEFKKHQELSRSGSGQKFKGGLGGHDEQSVRYHTATHLLNKALIEVLGDDVKQRGSNITPERLRFDFTHPAKMTDEEKKEVEDIVNEKIKEGLEVSCEEVELDKAKEKGAIGIFDDKYEQKVKIYKIGDFSLEICGGPHVQNTKELGNFKIKKEESVSAGVRRIKAILK